jgi:hypothetical protein
MTEASTHDAKSKAAYRPARQSVHDAALVSVLNLPVWHGRQCAESLRSRYLPAVHGLGDAVG